MDFSHKVYELTAQIPKGKVTTYKIISERLGCKAYRAVGNALNKNPYAPIVPCHRVVGTKGELRGFANGLEEKGRLLMEEGIDIKGNKVNNLNKYLFNYN